MAGVTFQADYLRFNETIKQFLPFPQADHKDEHDRGRDYQSQQFFPKDRFVLDRKFSILLG